jgi:hypothetical protein
MPGAAKSTAARRAWSELYVARGYLKHGFVDVAMGLFLRNAAQARREDWQGVADGLMAQERMLDAVDICRRTGTPLPRPALLALGDRRLRLKDVDAALRWYDIAGADSDRWGRLLDVLTATPAREQQAIVAATRYLAATAQATPEKLAAAI